MLGLQHGAVGVEYPIVPGHATLRLSGLSYLAVGPEAWPLGAASELPQLPWSNAHCAEAAEAPGAIREN